LPAAPAAGIEAAAPRLPKTRGAAELLLDTLHTPKDFPRIGAVNSPSRCRGTPT